MKRAGSLLSLGEVSIRRGVTTAMIYLCLTGFGLFSLFRLPLNRLPEVDLPVIAVITSYTGGAPQDMETLVTEPIERAVASVAGVEKITSTSRQGTSVVLINFTWGTNMDVAEIEVRKNLELFSGDLLPDEATKPLTFAFDPSLAPVLFMSLRGPMDGHQLRKVAEERIQPLLNRLEGVAAAEVMGGQRREVQVRIRPEWLQAFGIAPSQIVDALRAANVIVPAGAVETATQHLFIQPEGLIASIEELKAVTVGESGGVPIRLDHVAEVVDGFEDPTHIVTADGALAVMVAIRKQSNANTVGVSRTVTDALPKINAQLPEGVALVPLFDEASSIVRAISNLGMTGVQAFLLTGLILLLFLQSVRSSVIAAVAVPVSILVAFTFMDALDVTLNLISMAGLALAIGMLVDNGIVVLEATVQRLEQGDDAVTAARRGAEEMAMPLAASTLTTVVVFLPILLVEGIAGELFRDMVLTICVTLLVSLLVATSLVPLLMSRFMRGEERKLEALSAASIKRSRWRRFLAQLPGRYERALSVALDHPKRVLGGAILLFVGSMVVLPLLGKDFLPKADLSDIRIEVTADPGISLAEMTRQVEAVEALIHEEVPNAEVVTADYGSAEGFGALFGGAPNRGAMRVKLVPPSERDRSQQEIEAALARRFRTLPGLNIEMSTINFDGSTGDVEVKLLGDNLGDLRASAELLEARFLKIDGVRDVAASMGVGSPELEIRYNRERMRDLGLTPAQVSSALSAYYQGVNATLFRSDGDEHPVRVRAPMTERRDLQQLRYLPIPLSTGQTVPLASIATLRPRLGPTDIEREDQRRLAKLTVTGHGVDLGALTSELEQTINQTELPGDVQAVVGGSAEDLKDAFFKLGLALLAALVLVYMVLASQFESLLEPLVIMFTVPLAATGVVWALVLTRTTLQVTALVGVILLGGVVVNNGIVLVEVLKRRLDAGHDLREAALEAARTRIRPILMTALTTILGMAPLAVGVGDGAETWSPMARAVIGGMIVSTALTLFVIPTLYVTLVRRRGPRVRDNDRSEWHAEHSSDADVSQFAAE